MLIDGLDWHNGIPFFDVISLDPYYDLSKIDYDGHNTPNHIRKHLKSSGIYYDLGVGQVPVIWVDIEEKQHDLDATLSVIHKCVLEKIKPQVREYKLNKIL